MAHTKGKGVSHCGDNGDDAQGIAERDSFSPSLLSTSTLSELAARIRAEHEATIAGFKRSLEHAMTVGDLLLEAKDLLKHGEWLPWLRENTRIDPRLAQIYMRIARNREQIEAEAKCEKSSHLMTIFDATRLLAAPVNAEEDDSEPVAHGESEILRAAKDIRARKTEERRIERVAQLAEIAKGNTALSTTVRYPIIVADPAWRYECWNSDEATYDRGPRYPTMSLEEICALPVRDLATEIALLLLWVTSAHLEHAFDVIRAWSFTYCGESVWVKIDPASPDVIKLDPALGLGHWQRNQHESLLIARRGDFPLPPPHLRFRSVFFAPRRGHSVKPDEPYARIERVYPELPKIELFACQEREGWQRWGNQAPAAESPPPDSDSWNEMWARPFDYSKLDGGGR
jgi:N6-adenosine-specific RNA methylase IME4